MDCFAPLKAREVEACRSRGRSRCPCAVSHVRQRGFRRRPLLDDAGQVVYNDLGDADAVAAGEGVLGLHKWGLLPCATRPLPRPCRATGRRRRTCSPYAPRSPPSMAVEPLAALPTGRAGRWSALGLLAAVVAAAWLGVASPLLDWHRDRMEILEQRATLARRMAQIVAGLPALERAAQADRTAGPQADAVLTQPTDAVAAAAMLQALQDMAARAGAPLSSTETLPAETVGATAASGSASPCPRRCPRWPGCCRRWTRRGRACWWTTCSSVPRRCWRDATARRSTPPCW